MTWELFILYKMVKVQVMVKSIHTQDTFGICLVAKWVDTALTSYGGHDVKRHDVSDDVTDVESDLVESVSTCGNYSDWGSDSDSGHGRDGKGQV